MTEPGNICENCNFKYTMDAGNTVIYYFECQPWFSFGACMCPQCGASARLFFREQHQEYMEYFILHDIGFLTFDFPSAALVESFEQIYEVQPLKEYELTPRMEREINALSDWLALAPDEWITEMFRDPAPPCERPERWIT